ncbi:hypothetical protein [Blastococcus xanthinilyticus]|uniref:LGFP repeat-containing protein n=1 Tax=Blastococcus xanthinilyticus TaxID=1564164 RepID=A0A5S5D1J0_9ACTN|nr:hypothetical protein [Blastococcus xanthinilyticus]TYP89871.1 LGFP repeat-containing protein [Blastococcus xanthinilyticus]
MKRVVGRLPVALALALLTLATVLVAPLGPAPRVDLQPAADARQFNAGNIISDEVFFAGGSMSAPEVQAFLDVKNPACYPAPDGTPCLRNYRQSTPTMGATAFCGHYPGGGWESAADIIAKVGWACGVNPRVLLVLLQKEQSLVTAKGATLTPTRYQKATGFGCPDTAPCDPAFGGFFYQVYNAARQFQNYRINASRFGYRAGITQQIRWSPDAACGSGSVYVANQATAGLYNYTPYQPNAAALAAGYRTGDGCSAYGNRNFWLYYTDWFGSTQSPGGGVVAAKYASWGGAAGVLGEPRSLIHCGLRGGGCFQEYTYGAVHWSPGTGAFVTRGWIASRWSTNSREIGFLGYPLSDERPAAGGGAYQVFQGGTVYASGAAPTALVVRGWVLDRWSVLGREGGLLGFPSSEEVAVAGGVRQSFQGGVVSSSASTGAHEVHGSVLAKWDELGGEKGRLGFPTSDEVASLWGAYSTFSGGVIHAAAATGPQPVWGWVGARWVASGAGKAAVGYPVRPEAPAGDGVGAIGEFSNGLIVSSAATGAWDLVGPVAEKWTAMGGVKSFLGYPTAAPKAVAGGGSVSVFQGGSIYFSPATGAFEVHGWIRDKWLAKGGPVGLGYPTSDEQPAPGGGGVFQTYENGLIYSSAKKGAFEVHGLIEDKWAAMGGLSWAFGVPVSDEIVLPDGVGRASEFSSGAAIYFSPATGPWQVRGWVRNTWSQMGAERGFLGYPTSDEIPLPGGAGVEARFQGGRIWSSVATGAREVHGAILERYLALGGPASPLGLPTSNEEAVPGGRRSTFQNGTITCNTTTGAITVQLR